MRTNTSTPLFTIITSTLNAMDSVERCIESVSAQTFDNYEYIVVDGASTDGTAEFLNSHKELFSVLISEPDTGIYNAWNKALKHARGEWILFLGADDVLADKDVLGDVVRFLEEEQIYRGILYGDLILVAKGTLQETEIIHMPLEKLCSRAFLELRPQIPPHPAVFHHREVFSDRFVFDESYKISADSKLILHLICQKKVPAHYISRTINKMTVGGLSSAIGIRVFFEDRRLLRELQIPIPFFASLWALCKTLLKQCVQKVMGDQAAYRMIDFVRRLKGKPRIWGQ